jgi:hypothetical protein
VVAQGLAQVLRNHKGQVGEAAHCALSCWGGGGAGTALEVEGRGGRCSTLRNQSSNKGPKPGKRLSGFVGGGGEGGERQALQDVFDDSVTYRSTQCCATQGRYGPCGKFHTLK